MVAKQLLSSQPQLAYATFQAMLMMNLVDSSVLQQVVASTGQSAPPSAAVPPPAAVPTYQQPPPAQYPPPNLANVDPQRV
jgi:cleavage stimulation factor subunit 2